MQKHVLFICVHNSARSQMAETFLNEICREFFAAESAGLEPGRINPMVVEALQEIGIDISGRKTRSISDVLREGKAFDYVVTVCSEAEAEGCPFFPGGSERLHWPFPDPSKLTGPREERLRSVREIRDQIRAKIVEFCDEHCPAASGG